MLNFDFLENGLGIVSEHKASDCKTIGDIEEHQLILSKKKKKKLCFNSFRNNNLASECLSNRSCVKCKENHQFLICDKTTTTLLTASRCSVIYSVVLTKTEGAKCRALLDTRAGVSYT